MTRKYAPKDVEYRMGTYLIRLKHGHGDRREDLNCIGIGFVAKQVREK